MNPMGTLWLLRQFIQVPAAGAAICLMDNEKLRISLPDLEGSPLFIEAACLIPEDSYP